MADSSEQEKDAWTFAQRAVQCDQQGLAETATFYYMEAAQGLIYAHGRGSNFPNLLDKANEYLQRAEQLRQLGASSVGTAMKTSQQVAVERARFLIEQAMEEDEAGNASEATELYMQAAEMCIQLRDQTSDQAMTKKITGLAKQALDRAECLKGKTQTTKPPASPQLSHTRPHQTAFSMGPLGLSLRDEEPGSSQTRKLPASSPSGPPSSGGGGGGGGGGYNKEEVQVLRTTSCINGRNYVPFLAVDMKEKFGFPIPFTDKDGYLIMSPKQQSKFARWVRPEEIMTEPRMIYAISSFSIRQTIVSDCSFVASLAISAQYERRFRKKLITSVIYPQNRQGEPQYNPCGKYMVKLHINGVLRKIIIDDYLPVDRYGDLLCSYSNNKNELWVSLMEKAYMKVMGGYDFPGSNSNIDLHALTGWIPERVSIRQGSKEFDAIKEFEKIRTRFHQGHCLVTMATGEISEAEADRAGLVPTHAYAMLDVQEVRGTRLFQLKNPWSHLRWKGNFSEKDTVHWTPEMRKALNYDPKNASMFDNGVFWIDYDSLMRFFDVIYINWNPEIFKHTTCIHHTWKAKEGPKKDAYNIGDNPQYRLEVRAPGPSAVWILLTRHITDKDDFANNREFITLLVYKTQGKRVFYPHDPPPYKDGVRINSPHYLCKLVEDPGTRNYTLAISQYEKSNTIHYTLRVFSTCDFLLRKIAEPYVSQYEKQLTAEWKGRTAGGCGNNRETYKNNPIYQLRLDNNLTTNQLMIEIKAPKQFSVGFEVICVEASVTNSPGSFTKTSSGAYRPGFCVMELENVPGGIYNVTPSTFYPGQEGPFFLNISTNVPLTITRLQ